MPWDPARELRNWQQRLERLSHQPEPWSPAIDVYETDDRYVITAEVPGLTRDRIEIAVEDSRLLLRGRRTDTGRSGDIVHYHLVERGHGVFSRTFEFAHPIDAKRAEAELADGVLTIAVPKARMPPARRIDVHQG